MSVTLSLCTCLAMYPSHTEAALSEMEKRAAAAREHLERVVSESLASFDKLEEWRILVKSHAQDQGVDVDM
jgi:hypothetical protein